MMSSDDSKGSIRVPDAPFRPGEEASFDSWPWKPGDFSMPDPKTCEFKDTTELANGLVRVLVELKSHRAGCARCGGPHECC